jgi:hypothetical protein
MYCAKKPHQFFGVFFIGLAQGVDYLPPLLIAQPMLPQQTHNLADINQVLLKRQPPEDTTLIAFFGP